MKSSAACPRTWNKLHWRWVPPVSKLPCVSSPVKCCLGIVTAILLAFGRGIGDAASVLFTAGFTDRIPGSLMDPAASLPLAVFFQLGMPYPEVQTRAYASALVLTIIVLTISLGSRWIAGRLSKFIVK